MTSVRRRPLAALAAALAIVAGALSAASAPAGADETDRVLVFGSGFTNDFRYRDAVGTRLAALGHDVTVTSLLPSNLSPYDTIWHVGALRAFSSTERARLATFVSEGGGLHLSGEFSCCASLADLVNALVRSGGVVTGVGGSQPWPFSFEAGAVDGLTVSPNALTDFLGQSVGGLGGVDGANVVARAANGVAVGAAWAPADLTGDAGRLTVLMDISWLILTDPVLGSAETEARRMALIENFQEFLAGRAAAPVLADPVVTIESPADGAVVETGAPVELTASVADPGGGEVTCAIDWGDGAGAVTSVAAGVCGASHSYTAAGFYTVSVRSTAGDGRSGEAAAALVVFDRAGRFSGGGPVGQGGSFALSVRYHGDDPVPSGTFRYREGRRGPTLLADSFDWLVVDAAGVAVLEGTGTLDGVGGQRFRVTATPAGSPPAADVELLP